MAGAFVSKEKPIPSIPFAARCRYYKNADQAVKNIVGQYYPDLENLDLEEM